MSVLSFKEKDQDLVSDADEQKIKIQSNVINIAEINRHLKTFQVLTFSQSYILKSKKLW